MSPPTPEQPQWTDGTHMLPMSTRLICMHSCTHLAARDSHSGLMSVPDAMTTATPFGLFWRILPTLAVRHAFAPGDIVRVLICRLTPPCWLKPLHSPCNANQQFQDFRCAATVCGPELSEPPVHPRSRPPIA